MKRLAIPFIVGALLPLLAAASSGPASAKHKLNGAVISGATASSFPVNTGPKPVSQAPFGSYCFTPLGRLGPISVGPVGSPCTGASSQGPVAGQIVH